MSSTLRDLFPFGDANIELVSTVADNYPGLPAVEMAATFDYLKAIVDMLESFAGTLSDAGLSPARWRLLVALQFQAGPSGASIGEIADHLTVKEPTVTSTVDRAARDGLVQRQPDPKDGRVVRVVLTDLGHSTIRELLPSVAGRVAAFSGAMGGASTLQELALKTRRATEQIQDQRPLSLQPKE